jgi:multimeric flavodoxin WrbA
MHFLVIVASERHNGNSDLLGRLAVRYALKSGVDSGEIIYLKDFELKQCRGCLNCLKERHKCKLDDDLYRLLDIMQDADGIMLIAPVYVLTIPGKLKQLMDRYLAISVYLDTHNTGPAVSVGIAALPEWHQFQLPLMNTFLLSLGKRVVDSIIIYAAGPGEVLLSEKMEAVQSAIGKLISYQDKPFETSITKCCPIDYNTNFEHVEGNRFRCPVCLTPAILMDDGYHFDADDLNSHRWTQMKLHDHFENWILKTKPRFRSILKAIMQKKKEFGL